MKQPVRRAASRSTSVSWVVVYGLNNFPFAGPTGAESETLGSSYRSCGVASVDEQSLAAGHGTPGCLEAIHASAL